MIALSASCCWYENFGPQHFLRTAATEICYGALERPSRKPAQVVNTRRAVASRQASPALKYATSSGRLWPDHLTLPLLLHFAVILSAAKNLTFDLPPPPANRPQCP